MRITRLDAAPTYTLPLHDGIRSLRLVDRDQGSPAFSIVGLSHYPPGTRAGLSAGPTDKIYIVLEGELVIRLENEQPVVLRKLDSCYLSAKDRREVINESGESATLLVITP